MLKEVMMASLQKSLFPGVLFEDNLLKKQSIARTMIEQLLCSKTKDHTRPKSMNQSSQAAHALAKAQRFGWYVVSKKPQEYKQPCKENRTLPKQIYTACEKETRNSQSTKKFAKKTSSQSLMAKISLQLDTLRRLFKTKQPVRNK